MNILISACLLGQYCRYDGKTKVYPQVQDLLGRDDIHLIPVVWRRRGQRLNVRTVVSSPRMAVR